MAPVESDSARFSRALRSAILWPAGLILFAACLMLVLIIMALRYEKWSEHSYTVIAQTRICENLIFSSQAAYRGFFLTDDRSIIGSFAARRAEADSQFQKLADLVQDNALQEAKMENLIREKDHWFDYVKVMLGEHSTKGPVAPAWIEMAGKMVDGILAQFQAFDDVEQKLHAQRAAHAESTRHATVFAGGALALILAVTIGQMVRRQFTALAAGYREALTTIEQRHNELLRSEADLEQQKEWFRVTLSSIGDGVIVTDREGRVVFLNQEAERLTGWNNVEALLKPLAAIFRVVDENTRAKEEDPATRVFREKKVIAMSNHAVLLSRLGDEWPIEDSAAPIYNTQAEMIGVVVVFHNATDSRRAQQALRLRSEDLEKRVAERTIALQRTVADLESFSYSVSHDLRSPLRAMQGFAQAVLEDYGDKIGNQGKDYLNRIKNAAERLDRLIQDLLLFTRLSRDEAELVPVNVEAALRETLANDPSLNPPSAVVAIEGILPSVMGQKASLIQVLSNLLGNAAKFVPPGTSPRIRVWCEDLGERVRLWVEDNGIGISPDDYERIFRMFVQVGDSHLYGGTGMGLAIVKKAVEAMKGTVGLVPAEGGGCRFWIELGKAS